MSPVEREREHDDDSGKQRPGDNRDGTPRRPIVVWLRVLAGTVGTCPYALAARLGRSTATATTAVSPLPSLSGHDDAADELVPAEATRHDRSHRHSPDSSRSKCRPSPDHTPTRRSRQHRSRLASPSPHTPNNSEYTQPCRLRPTTHRSPRSTPPATASVTLSKPSAQPSTRSGSVMATTPRTARPESSRSPTAAPSPAAEHQTPAAITTQRVGQYSTVWINRRVL